MNWINSLKRVSAYMYFPDAKKGFSLDLHNNRVGIQGKLPRLCKIGIFFGLQDVLDGRAVEEMTGFN